jgi:hypothetical protein
MTNREAWAVNRFEEKWDGVVTEDCFHSTIIEVRLYNDNDLVNVFDSMEEAIDWLNEEENED